MDIIAKCSKCDEDVGVSQGKVYVKISTCKKCDADVKLQYVGLDGVKQEVILKNK